MFNERLLNGVNVIYAVPEEQVVVWVVEKDANFANSKSPRILVNETRVSWPHGTIAEVWILIQNQDESKRTGLTDLRTSDPSARPHCRSTSVA
jgi:hypothetical protein